MYTNVYKYTIMFNYTKAHDLFLYFRYFIEKLLTIP